MSKIFLKPTNEKIRQKRIYGFDIETYGKYNKFLMGSIVNEEERYVFWDKDEMISFIYGSHKIRNSVLFATNLGFDFLGLFGEDMDKLKDFDIIMRGSEFIIIDLMDDKQGLKFLDTMSFYKAGVARIAKIVGLQKMDKPDCLGKKVDRYSIDGQILEQYNINDSYVTFRFASFLQESFNELGCNMKSTLASTSMHLFKNKYLKGWIQQPERYQLEFMFKGYYGGRVEAFKRGRIENLKYYDVNSLYPYVMREYEYPDPNSIREEDEPTIDMIQEYEGLTYCKASIDNFNHDFIPILPLRHDGKLIFPVGIFYGFYSNVELRKAIELGYEIEPIFSFLYTRTFNPFREYITDLYNKRLEYKLKGSPLEMVAKICMNSLYGKFSQKLTQSKMLFRGNPRHEKELLYYIHHNSVSSSQGKKLKYKIEAPENIINEDADGNFYDDSRFYYVTDLFNINYPNFINPIISLYVTSYGRLELYKYFQSIKESGHSLYYCDTDSIVTDKEFPTSDKLGDLKLEFNIKKGIIVKPKFYYFEDYEKNEIVKTKGLQNLKSYVDFKKTIDTGKYKTWRFSKFRESVKRKIKFNQKIDVEKVLDFEDNKREWFGRFFNPVLLQESAPRYIIEFFDDEKEEKDKKSS